MNNWKKQGTSLIYKDSANYHHYEIKETEIMKFTLLVDRKEVYHFDNLEYAKRVASLIEEDAWN